jgi:hypothetical protein
MRKPSFIWATMRGPLSPLLSYTVVESHRVIAAATTSVADHCDHGHAQFLMDYPTTALGFGRACSPPVNRYVPMCDSTTHGAAHTL